MWLISCDFRFESSFPFLRNFTSALGQHFFSRYTGRCILWLCPRTLASSTHKYGYCYARISQNILGTNRLDTVNRLQRNHVVCNPYCWRWFERWLKSLLTIVWQRPCIYGIICRIHNFQSGWSTCWPCQAPPLARVLMSHFLISHVWIPGFLCVPNLHTLPYLLIILSRFADIYKWSISIRMRQTICITENCVEQ